MRTEAVYPTQLEQDVPGHLTMNICQSKISARVVVGQTLVVQAKHVQNGGMPIVDVHPPIHRLTAQRIGRAVDHATLHPTACQHTGEV